jgi:hypothetical protein
MEMMRKLLKVNAIPVSVCSHGRDEELGGASMCERENTRTRNGDRQSNF